MTNKISEVEYMEMYEFIGAAMEVYNTLGRGLEEAVYQEALSIELNKRNLPFVPQRTIDIWYKDVKMEKYYVADFYFKGIMVELKSTSNLISEHRAQLFNYMRLGHVKKGLLVNFGEQSLRVERYIYSNENDDFILLTKSNYKEYIDKKNSE